ncbi:helix-turn-helix domain-containing protein [Kribbella solani]|uniref:Excisionase family DNA binding protein n=1 Tax=Kribbella solani TaxID=236067 RepID=A0A841DU72_9ACTN|nr:helix-turn-helix domain-containing protein [Kribbella solani]MBB5981501.1 excisionase family DNA binding protein [Kribbella solani]
MNDLAAKSDESTAAQGSLQPMTTLDVLPTTPLLLTVEQAAQRLGIGRTSVYALLKTGEIESVPVGRLRRIPTECLDEYVRRLRSQIHTATAA